MRDIQLVLERWGGWAANEGSQVGWSPTSGMFKSLIPHGSKSRLSCSDDDGMIIDACVGKLKQKRPDEYSLLCEHYIKDISKRALGRKLKLSEGMVRTKFLMAEGFIEGCLSMLDVQLEMDNWS